MILWKCELIATTSVSTKQKTCECLRFHKIPFVVKQADDDQVYFRGRIDHRITHPDTRKALYRIFVKKKDLLEASELLHQLME